MVHSIEWVDNPGPMTGLIDQTLRVAQMATHAADPDLLATIAGPGTRVQTA
jgi:hypothetical protein